MIHMSVDIETKSSVDIGKSGAYKYAQSPDFEILLFAFKLDDGPTEVIDLTKDKIPAEVVGKLSDPRVIKHAYNAAFEWWCLTMAGYDTPLNQWQCTMAHALYCGYPAGLAATGVAIGLPQEKQKLTTGRALIRYFCVPCKATKKNGGRTWNFPHHDPDKWDLFIEYNRQDVEAEYEIGKRLQSHPMPDREQLLWQMDVEMNAYGVMVDTGLIRGALAIDAESSQRLTEKAVKLTGLDNPNSTAQLLPWLESQGVELPNLQKATVEETLKEDIPDNVREVLRIRQKLGKTSIKKYVAMENAKCRDDRIRGLTQYYGANRTGRYAGRLVQMQNLPRNYLKQLDAARKIVKAGNYEGLRMIFGNVPDTLSQLIRTAFIPLAGDKFVVADFSAIEARVIAWLAKEEWVNEVFRTTGKIYEATASQMFHVPQEKIAKGNPEYALRQRGKIATLALGYQGGVNAMKAMGADRMGIPEEELEEIVRMWREANPNIRSMWYEVEKAAVECVTYGRKTSPKCKIFDPERARENERLTGAPAGSYSDLFLDEAPINGICFRMEVDPIYGQSFLTVGLPSGRKLFYPGAFLQENKFGKTAIHYYALGANKKWGVESTYGGKLTENIVQAVARDCLAEILLRIRKEGWNVVFHVHDEVIVEAPDELTVDHLCDLMAEPIPWAPGLVLKGAGFENDYYMKD